MTLIAVDSGHGMATAGKCTPPIPEAWFGKEKGDIIHEKEFNKATAEFLIKALERCGFDTLNVSPGDTDVTIKDRYTRANNAKADLFVSKHYNANTGKWGTWSGICTYISQFAGEDEKRLAKLVQAELVKEHKRKDRGVVVDYPSLNYNVGVLKNTKMPAILTESGFMDNLAEAKTMLDPVFQKADAEATCRGICAFLGVKYIPESKQLDFTRITTTSPKEHIHWLQQQLNACITSGYKVKETGVYDSVTRIGVLIYWDQLGWGRHMEDDGKIAGKSTTAALKTGRKV